MVKSHTDEGVIEALLERITTVIIPKVMAIKAKIDRGEKLSDYDIQVLLQIYERNLRNREIFHRYPEYDKLETELMALYAKVIQSGLNNEDQ